MSEMQKDSEEATLTCVWAVILVFEGTVSIHSLFSSEKSAQDRADSILDGTKNSRVTFGMEARVICMEVEP